MDAAEYMKKHGLTDAALDEMAAPYEGGDFELGDASFPIYSGSHLDRVGKKRVTVAFDASDTQRVQNVARSKGVKPSEIYRLAVHQYLDGQDELKQA